MLTNCPKCGYARRSSDTAPAYECPKCGVIYAKAKPRGSVDSIGIEQGAIPSGLQNDVDAPKSKGGLELSQRQLLIGALLAGLIIGYFLGREHVKYELRSAFQDAAAGISKGIGNAFGGSDSKPKEKRVKAPDVKKFPIKATLQKKGFFEGEYGKNAITFTVDFENTTGKAVRAFDGALVFTDLLGNEIISAALAINDPIDQGQKLTWEGKLDFNQFIAAHGSLRSAEIQNTKTVFVLKRVLFQDGEVREF